MAMLAILAVLALIAQEPAQVAPLAPSQAPATSAPATSAPQRFLELPPPETSAPSKEAMEAAASYSERFSGRAVLVLHAGQVVFERYANGWSAERPHALASGTKSFCGIVAAAAVTDGLVKLEEPVVDTLVEWKDNPRAARMTVRSLLDLSSGLEPESELFGRPGYGIRDLGPLNDMAGRLRGGSRERAPEDWYGAVLGVPITRDPGRLFRYGPSHFYAWGALLTRKLATSERAEKTYWDYMRARVFEPAGLALPRERFALDAKGQPNLPGGAHLTAREWARFGEFVRLGCTVERAKDDGSLERVAVIGRDALEACFVPSAANGQYGLTWWLANDAPGTGVSAADGAIVPADAREFRGLRAADGTPLRIAQAAGAGKQRLYLVPQRALVIVRFAELDPGGRGFEDEPFLRQLLELGPERAPVRSPRPVAPRESRPAAADSTLPWVTPAVRAPRVDFRTFDSAAAKAVVSYHVYTPPQYDAERERRFPVVYWLHGSGGGVAGIAPVAARFDAAIRSGDLPPVIVVFPNGLPNGMWCDSHDGRTPVETVFIEELLPEVDRVYRTRPERAGRILEGFSMGGYGAGRLGFVHHELFGAVSMLGAGPLHPEFEVSEDRDPAQRDRLLASVWGDLERYRAASPWQLAERHLAAVQQLPLRIVIGSRDSTLEFNRSFHERLEQLAIPHEYLEVPGIRHDPDALLAALDRRFWTFHSRFLAPSAPPPAAPPAPTDR